MAEWRRMATFANGKRRVSRLYLCWENMRKRCYMRSRVDYPHYGGRGIRICDEWRDNFAAFRAWALKHGYRKGLTIDRYPEMDGNYGPSNCRWATREEQTYNSSRCHSLTLNGVTKILPLWAKELGTTPDLLRARRSQGWTDEQILTTPRLPSGVSRPGVRRGRRPKHACSAKAGV